MFAKNIRILVVDDAEVIREVVSKFFHELGYENVDVAVDGEEAWTRVQGAVREGRPYELIISDFTMPRLDGFGLLKNVRNHPQSRETPFVLLTAESDRERVMMAIQLGVTQFVVKPFNLATFTEAIKAAYHTANGPRVSTRKKVG